LSISDLEGFAHRLTPTVSSPGAAHALGSRRPSRRAANCHLKIDTE
jgi:hypothetical protein